jgi:hypothetical protein
MMAEQPKIELGLDHKAKSMLVLTTSRITSDGVFDRAGSNKSSTTEAFVFTSTKRHAQASHDQGER